MILVTGGTGTVGREVVRELLARNARVRIVVRDPAKAGAHARGAEVVVGDLDRPNTLDPAFSGIEKLFLLSNGPEEAERNAIDAAVRSGGIQHIVKLSSMGFGPERHGLAIGHWHRAVEAHLSRSGIPSTVLLASGYASNALGWAETIRTQGAVFAATGEGKVGVIDPRDIAAVAATALTEVGHEGQRYELTGPEALSFAEQVSQLGKVIGRELRFVDVPAAAARDAMLRTGMPEPLVNGMLEVMSRIRAGDAATLSPDMERVLGRKPRTFAAWATDHAAAFR